MILIDGVSAGDLGGRFDFGPLSTTAVERAEVYRGPNSSLYGADAASGVVSLTTPHGTTRFSVAALSRRLGKFPHFAAKSWRQRERSNKLDYLGAFSWLQTANDLPNDEYHVATAAANLDWQPTGSRKFAARCTTAWMPRAFPAHGSSITSRTMRPRRIRTSIISASIDNQTTADFHNMVRYGRRASASSTTCGTQSGAGVFDAYGDSFGDLVTITGANGYSVTGRALMDYAGTYPQGYQLVSNRDQLVYQGDYTVTPHLAAQIGFQFEDERDTSR